VIYTFKNVSKITGSINDFGVDKFQIVEINTEDKTVLIYKQDKQGQIYTENGELATELLKPARVHFVIDSNIVKWEQ